MVKNIYFPKKFKVILNTLQPINQIFGSKVFEDVKWWISNGLIFFRVMFCTTIGETPSSLMDSAVCRKAPDLLYNIWKEQSEWFV